MRRPDSLATVALAAARVLDGERPQWLSVEAWEGLRGATRAVLDEARSVVSAEGVDGAPPVLGLGRRTIQRAREPGGPLAP